MTISELRRFQLLALALSAAALLPACRSCPVPTSHTLTLNDVSVFRHYVARDEDVGYVYVIEFNVVPVISDHIPQEYISLAELLDHDIRSHIGSGGRAIEGVSFSLPTARGQPLSKCFAFFSVSDYLKYEHTNYSFRDTVTYVSPGSDRWGRSFRLPIPELYEGLE